MTGAMERILVIYLGMTATFHVYSSQLVSDRCLTRSEQFVSENKFLFDEMMMMMMPTQY